MDSRRQLIADAALTVIGTEGIRALTHHRVDDQAGLSRGSTSWYCRRRVDTLSLALQRLYTLDEAALRAASQRVLDATDEATPAAAHAAVVRASVAELVHGWLTEERLRSIARVELFMAASHEPELHPQLAEQLAGMRAAAAPMASRGDAGAAQQLVAGFMLIDGLMLGVLREGRPAPERAEIEALLATIGAGA